MKKSFSLAKISRPSLSKVFPRTRLFKLLDKGRDTPVTWISGPAGSGKTTLVASYLDARKLPCIWYTVDKGDADLAGFFYYMGLAVRKSSPRFRRPLPLLTPEYLLGLPVFVRRYFEEVCSRVKPPFAIVFDNYQDIQGGVLFSEMLAAGIEAVPPGISVIIMSRTVPPPEFARLQASGRIHMLQPEELRMNEEEAGRILRLKHSRPTTTELKALVEKTRGWAAGIVLQMERWKLQVQHSPSVPRDFDSSVIFDYFATEIFGKTEHDSRQFLLKAAFLNSMTVSLAERLTGERCAATILSNLTRDNYFTEVRLEQEPIYQFHPLFRDFLRVRARAVMPQGEVRGLQLKAAGLAAEAGWVEEAAELYRECANHAALAALIGEHAVELLGTGRSQTLMSWLDALPGEVIDSSPWLQYWSGICRMGFAPAEGRRNLEQAFALFQANDDAPGMMLAWSFIVDSYAFEWNDFHPLDHWISVFFEVLQRRIPALPHDLQARVSAALTLALMIRRPGHPDIAGVVEQTVASALECTDTGVKMQGLMLTNVYYSWIGDFSRCSALSGHLQRSVSLAHMTPPYQLMFKVIVAGRHLFDISGVDEAEHSVSAALDFGAAKGLKLWDHVLYALGIDSSLALGDLRRAGQYLERLRASLVPSRKESQVQYYMLSCWIRFLEGNYARAYGEIESGLKLSRQTGYIFPRALCLNQMANVLLALHDSRALDSVEEALMLAKQSGSRIIQFSCLLTKAAIVATVDPEQAALDVLREALVLGRTYRYFSLLWWWDPALMSRLVGLALENDIEPEYVRELIRVRRLAPGADAGSLETWPWPLKIYTLGAFRIEKDGKFLTFTGKVQQKPLEMLKLLAAQGGNDVADEKIMETLWPDADGDTAFQSFETTLHRLRKLLGNDSAIIRSESRIRIDPRVCWIDAGAFDHLVREAGQQEGPGSLGPLVKAIGLYHGNFLAGEKERPWMISFRERLRSRFLRAVSAVGRILEQDNQWEAAAVHYQKALEIDDLAEEFYQRLMVCQGRLGRRAEVIATLERCRKVLFSVVGIEPSPKTLSIFKEIIP